MLMVPAYTCNRSATKVTAATLLLVSRLPNSKNALIANNGAKRPKRGTIHSTILIRRVLGFGCYTHVLPVSLVSCGGLPAHGCASSISSCRTKTAVLISNLLSADISIMHSRLLFASFGFGSATSRICRSPTSSKPQPTGNSSGFNIPTGAA